MESYWGERTSNVDFCEANYVHSPYVAELLNAATAIPIAMLAVWGWVLTPVPFRSWRRFQLSWFTLMLCGFGSVLFHTTLKRAAQGADEIPLMLVDLVFIYCLAFPKRDRIAYRTKRLVLLALALITIYTAFEWYAIFFVVLAVESFGLIAYSRHLTFQKKGKNGALLRFLWKVDLYISIAGFLVWAWGIDDIECSRVGSAYLHIVWHLLGAVGSAMFPLLLVGLTADKEGFALDLRWSWGLMPFLVLTPPAVPAAGSSQTPTPSAVSDRAEQSQAAQERREKEWTILPAIMDIVLAFVLQNLVQWGCLLERLDRFVPPLCRGFPDEEEENEEAEAEEEHTGPSVSFSGCAFWWPYMAGVCQYLYEEFDLTDVKMYCTSASSFPVVCAMVGVNPLNWCMVDYPRCLEHWYARPLRCFVDSTAFLRRLWHAFLPADAYRLVENRLVVSITCLEIGSFGLPTCVNKSVSSFLSNADLVDTLMATINLPGFFFRGLPKWRGLLTVDGGYSERMRQPGGKTVVVAAHSLMACDLCPSKTLPKTWLLLPQPMENTKEMMRLGYEDARAKRFLFEARGWRAKVAGPAQ
jgi:dihydroceramidase